MFLGSGAPVGHSTRDRGNERRRRKRFADVRRKPGLVGVHIGVSFIQTYIFVLLSAVYLGGALSEEH